MENKRKETIKQSIMFTVLSISAALVEFISFTILNHFKIPYIWAHVSSIILSVLWNFTLNRKYTFKSASNVPIAMFKASLFYLFFIPITAFLGQKASLIGINDFLIKGLTMVSNFVGEFLWWKFFVFKDNKNIKDLSGI